MSIKALSVRNLQNYEILKRVSVNTDKYTIFYFTKLINCPYDSE